MNEKLDRILSEISDMRTQQAVTNTQLEHYNEQLKTHIKRTEILESEVHDLWRWKFLVAGGIAVISVAAPLFIKYLMKD